MPDVNARNHLRHCMVVYSPYPYAETRVQREAEALVSHGHEVDVICPLIGDEDELEFHSDVTIYRIKMHWGQKENLAAQFSKYISFFLLASFKLTRLHFHRHYNAIQVHNLPDFLVFAALLPKIMGARVILDLHDLMPEFYQGRFKQSLNHFLHRLIYWQESLSCKFADHVITVTGHWRQTLIKRGVPSKKCSVVMNLADTRIFYPLSFIDTAAKDKSRYCLFYHGTMPEHYGLDLVLRAVAMLREKIPNIHFMLVGGGRYLGSLKQLAKDLDLNEEYVEFIKLIPAEKLRSYIAQADVCVVPYRNDVFTDSLLPTKLIEYAAMGLPSIASRTTAISAYFDENMVEFFRPCDVDDLTRCILRLYENPARREQLAGGIRRFNDRYNWEEGSAAYVACIERLCSKAGHR